MAKGEFGGSLNSGRSGTIGPKSGNVTSLAPGACADIAGCTVGCSDSPGCAAKARPELVSLPGNATAAGGASTCMLGDGPFMATITPVGSPSEGSGRLLPGW